MSSQIKSKKRVKDHAEVYTNEREVNAMLDLVKCETERIDSRFLEPACGNGNFLDAILRRKMEVVSKLFKNNKYEYSKHSFIVVTSLYGVDILEDNVEECRERLLDTFNEIYVKDFGTIDNDLSNIIKYVLEKNILLGDALTLCLPNTNDPIIFPEWTMLLKGKVKRKDYRLAELLNTAPREEDKYNLFSDLGDEVFVPVPEEDYNIVDFMEVDKYE